MRRRMTKRPPLLPATVNTLNQADITGRLTQTICIEIISWDSQQGGL